MRRPWNFNADTLIRVDSEPAAIEALEIRAPEVIRGADELNGGAGDRRSTVAGRLLRLAGHAAARSQKQHQNNRGDSIAQESFLTPIRAPLEPYEGRLSRPRGCR